MLCNIISITDTRITPETYVTSAYVFFLKVTTVAHIIRSISAVLIFVEDPQPNLTSREKKKTFLNVELE